MLRWLAPAALLLACNDDPACLIDTDCAGFDICLENQCVPRGGPQDAAVDGPTPRDASDDEDAGVDMGPEPGSLGRGTVTLFSAPAGADPTMDPGSYTVTASFTANSDDGLCSTSTVAGCTVTDCEPPPPPTDAGVPMDAGTPEPDPAPHAGPLQVSGGAIAITMMPDEATGRYAAETGSEPLFSSGTEMVVQAPGDEVPAFRTANLLGVTPISVSEPALPGTGPLTVPQDSDLAITWLTADDALEGAIVRATIVSSGSARASGSQTITCDFVAADGSGAVPAAVLAMVDPTGRSTTIQVTHRYPESLERDGWIIDVETWARARGASRDFNLGLAFGDPTM